jgi:hypothetical protein
MRFSIVLDDNGTILAASVGGKEANNVIRRTSVSSGYFDISDEVPDAEPSQVVEQVLGDMDARKLKQLSAREEADDAF